ncbi:uncharacterized protein V2V93DRAFT_101693 [Kockiozyma suomiensis]|uniref:uncharacterized protein n=1 Tax=Kockiozyma suomiensis TaxID=1337062 RepID=UPI0033431F91
MDSHPYFFIPANASTNADQQSNTGQLRVISSSRTRVALAKFSSSGANSLLAAQPTPSAAYTTQKVQLREPEFINEIKKSKKNRRLLLSSSDSISHHEPDLFQNDVRGSRLTRSQTYIAPKLYPSPQTRLYDESMYCAHLFSCEYLCDLSANAFPRVSPLYERRLWYVYNLLNSETIPTFTSFTAAPLVSTYVCLNYGYFQSE